MAVVLFLMPYTNFGQAPNLGLASSFAVFTAAGEFKNVGVSNITGNIGTGAGAFSGFPPGVVTGQIHIADAVSIQAGMDVATAYGQLAATLCGSVIGVGLGNNQTLMPGVYCTGGASTLTGNLTLDGLGDPNALFIIQIDGALSTNTLSRIQLINGASSCGVYWQINGALSLASGTSFAGTALVNGAISFATNATLQGRALSREGAISLSSNAITLGLSVCLISGSNFICQAGQATQLCATATGTYLWSTGAITSCIVINAPGTYGLTVTQINGCRSTCSKTVVVDPQAACLISGTGFICQAGQSTQLCTTAPGTYLWSTGAITNCITVNVPGTYGLTVTEANGCSSTCSKTVTIDPQPMCIIFGSDVVCLAEQPTQLCTTALGTYLWSTGATTSCISVNAAGTYSLTATEANGCVSTCSKTLIAAQPICIVATSSFICQAGQPTQLCTTDPGAFQWSTGATTDCITVNAAGIYGMTVTDAHGCTNRRYLFEIQVNDTLAPIITCPTNIIRSIDAGVCTAIVTYATPSATDNCSIASVLVAPLNLPSGDAFNKGLTSVTWEATDSKGLTARCTFTVTVMDNQAPTITCPGNMSVGNTLGQCSATVNYNLPVALDNCALAPGSPTLQSGLASGGIFPKGQTTVVWRAVDAGGLTKTCSFRVTVNDTQAPTFTSCPSNYLVNTAVGSCSSDALNYPVPTAADNCTLSPVVMRINGLASGSAFPVGGPTLVVWRAIDGAGRSSTCMFSVTVTDNQPPTITCPLNILQNNPANACSTPVLYANPVASDNCGINSLYLASGLGSGSIFPVGTTNNVWRAVDNTGRSSSCAFMVTVVCSGNASRGVAERVNTQPGQLEASLVNLSLVPNPAVSEVWFTVSGLNKQADELLVFDCLGRLVMRHPLVPEQGNGNFDVSALPEGLYRVSLRTEKKVVTKNLVVGKE